VNWIPAFAGMTVEVAGMTMEGHKKTPPKAGLFCDLPLVVIPDTPSD